MCHQGEDLTMTTTLTTTLKSAATSVAAVAAIGAAGLGVTAAAFVPASPDQVQLAAVGAPMPQDPPPAPGLPTPEQLSTLCTQVTDPGVNYRDKNNFVENGVSQNEGMVADHDLRKAWRTGNFPE